MGQKIRSIYSTLEIEARIMEIYDDKLRNWPVDYESRFIPTKYGLTHVLACGPSNAPPIVLLHAMGVTATMWKPNIEELSKDYRVYAIDTIGDIGKSQLASIKEYPRCGADYAAWLDNLFNKLEISEVNLIGASMGGWIAMNFSKTFPDKIRRLILLGPMGISPATLRVLRNLWKALLFPSTKNVEKIILWAVGDNERSIEAFTEHMRAAVHCRGKMPIPKRFRPDQLKRIKVPVLLILGGKDQPIGPPMVAKNIAERCLPDVTVEIVEKAGHVISSDDPERVNATILDFLR